MKLRALISAIALIVALGAPAQKIFRTNAAYSADLKVCEVNRESRADLVVYVTDKAYKAKAEENKGIWFFTDRAYNADKKVFFVDHEYQADLRVYFTDKPYRAGWRTNKRHLLY